MTEEGVIFRPQPKQELFLKSSADVCLYGGAAGGGKTTALLADPLYHKDAKGFGAVQFRRTIAEITLEGGLWDESQKFYPQMNAEPNLSAHSWTFPSGAKVTFSGIQYEQDLDKWRGAQIAAEYFDQLETFERRQFFYMLTRNRSTCGVKPYVRGTCNPQPGWLADFIDWYIAEDGYADLSRAGKIRWFVVVNEQVYWADRRQDLIDKFPNVKDLMPKSFTFIPATIYDNAILLQKDPNYLSNLQAQSLVDRERLLGDPRRGGNWKIKPEAGNVFNRDWFNIVTDWDKNRNWRFVIRFDFAATARSIANDDPDFTAWCVEGRDPASGEVLVLECDQKRMNPSAVYDEFVSRCEYWRDYLGKYGFRLKVRWEREPGSASKREERVLASLVPWADARGIPSSGSKIDRARPLAAQAEHGFVFALKGNWTEAWLNHLHSQPADHDDMMDATTGGYSDLISEPTKTVARSYGG